MAGHPLRSATDRRLGGPLPRQLANQTRGHLEAINLWHKDHATPMRHAVLAVVSNCCPPLQGRFLTRYSPVRHFPLLPLSENSFSRFSFDLHVLSTPPAFVLSQDQTLHDRLFVSARFCLAFLTQILCGFLFFLKLAHRLFSRCTVQFSKNHRSKRLHYFSTAISFCQAFF